MGTKERKQEEKIDEKEKKLLWVVRKKNIAHDKQVSTLLSKECTKWRTVIVNRAENNNIDYAN